MEFNSYIFIYVPILFTLFIGLLAYWLIGSGQGSAELIEVLEKFKTNHPNIYVPFELIETWPQEKFSESAHVKNESVNETSERLGKALRDYMISNW